MMPSLFLAHGSPMLALENTEYTQFLARLGSQLQPKEIVIFTAHWEKETITISAIDGTYETIYDFYGFPPELYKIKYPAKGSVRLAEKIQTLFAHAGIPAHLDTMRGLDHGSWTLLYKMYPKADIPVVQISVHPFLEPEKQYRIGKAIQELADEDILIIGSGVTVHNLRAVNWNQTEPELWAVQFDDWLMDQLEKQDFISLFQYDKLAPNAKLAVPRPEHFVPLLIAAGSGSGQPKVIYRSYEFGSLSYLCIQF
ncbi:DODA-type extradiol aromatic ring-opening family dioxygenase [Neobacillus fumarioli]|uniref:DODA-type extradiol aromatic ring-opening family dioxygenase n=1 Tax=Neobacillus fumarioli TaxID=105229 RepID=UPI000834F0E6|nr:class III extradiol ring-cleavage dioxygenase [Neobacillus fumarioli]